ncbi:MAG: 2-hydroxyacid dehydrogenase [Actinomycetota bacterium]
MKPVVAVAVPEEDARREWVARLAPRLEGAQVVDAEEADPSSVHVLVVSNPPGSDLARFPGLRFVQSVWAGVDRLEEGAPPVSIARMVAPELTEAMTQFVLAVVLGLHRSFPAYRRDQMRREWHPRPLLPARERTVGVLGHGELGRPAALALADLGFDVAAWARTPRAGQVEVLAGCEGLAQLLSRSGIVVNLLPLTRETRNILDERTLGLMPPGSSLVNVGRGAHVVEEALLGSLDSGHLSEAVLDVFDSEPLPADHPYWSHPRVTVFPHVAAPSAPVDLAPWVAANIQAFLVGDTPRFLVR